MERLAEHFKLMPALCLDVESTIRRSKSGAAFIIDADDIELRPGIERILWTYREMGYLNMGFSDQNDRESGLKLPPQIILERDATVRLFENVPLDLINYSFCGGEGTAPPYSYRSLCRMPYYGGLAIAEVNAYNQGIIIDWNKSLLVGDRPEHALCAKTAGITFRTAHSFLNEPHTFEG